MVSLSPTGQVAQANPRAMHAIVALFGRCCIVKSPEKQALSCRLRRWSWNLLKLYFVHANCSHGFDTLNSYSSRRSDSLHTKQGDMRQMKSPSASRALVIAPEPHPINICKPVTDCFRKTWTCTWITDPHSHSYVSITPFPRHAPSYSASLSLILIVMLMIDVKACNPTASTATPVTVEALLLPYESCSLMILLSHSCLAAGTHFLHQVLTLAVERRRQVPLRSE
jgi:hypothetical protein